MNTNPQPTQESKEVITEPGARFSASPLRLSLPAFALLIALASIMLFTRPATGGPALVLGVLLLSFLLFLTVGFIVQSLIQYFFKWKGLIGPKRIYLSTLGAIGGVFLVGLQTLSQLQLTDIILIILFELLLNFYIIRRF